MNRTVEQIKQDMLDIIKNTEDKTENSFIHDAIAPASLELFNAYRQQEQISNKFIIENLEGEELARYINQVTGIKRKQATTANGVVKVIGDDNVVIEEGLILVTENIIFITTQAQTIAGGVAKVNVVAVDSGGAGNILAGAITGFEETITGVTSVTNEETFTNGYDEETDEQLLQRYYEQIRTPATSGNRYHYINWAKEVEGVGDAKVVSLWNGNGTVKVIIVGSDGLPVDEEIQTNALDYINDNRPIGADVTVVSAEAKDISVLANITVADGYTIQGIKDSFEANLNEYRQGVSFKESYVSYASISNILFGIEGVLDYTDLTLNGALANVVLGSIEVPVFTPIELEVV